MAIRNGTSLWRTTRERGTRGWGMFGGSISHERRNPTRNGHETQTYFYFLTEALLLIRETTLDRGGDCGLKAYFFFTRIYE